jgi:hypothetical protein
MATVELSRIIGMPEARFIIFCLIIFTGWLTCSNTARCETLLPSQDLQGLFTAKTCQDRYVLSIIGSTIDAVLHTKSIIAKGMNADDIRLEAVNANQNAVLCSMTVAARGLTETVTYVIGIEGSSFVITLSGNRGSKLFPHEITMRPAT